MSNWIVPITMLVSAWITYLLIRLHHLKTENAWLQLNLDARNESLEKLGERARLQQNKIYDLEARCAVLERNRVIRLPVCIDNKWFSYVQN